jgi:protein-disulfide isomerase
MPKGLLTVGFGLAVIASVAIQFALFIRVRALEDQLGRGARPLRSQSSLTEGARSHQIPPDPVGVPTSPGLGAADAAIVVVEFSDFECPFCRRFARDTFPVLKRQYIDTGRLFWVFRHLPLKSAHPMAETAARAAHCASEVGSFWQLHGLLFEQATLDVGIVKDAMRRAGIASGFSEDCLTKQSTQRRIEEDLRSAAELAVSSTPTFMIGTRQPDGRVRIVQRLHGAQPPRRFAEVLDTLISVDPAGAAK